MIESERRRHCSEKETISEHKKWIYAERDELTKGKEDFIRMNKAFVGKN
jgi:hypothetical protein